MSLYPLLIVALIVFAGIWLYLWNLDAKVDRLDKELREAEQERLANQ